MYSRLYIRPWLEVDRSFRVADPTTFLLQLSNPSILDMGCSFNVAIPSTCRCRNRYFRDGASSPACQRGRKAPSFVLRRCFSSFLRTRRTAIDIHFSLTSFIPLGGQGETPLVGVGGAHALLVFNRLSRGDRSNAAVATRWMVVDSPVPK